MAREDRFYIEIILILMIFVFIFAIRILEVIKAIIRSFFSVKNSKVHIDLSYRLHWLHPMCNPLMCNIVPNVQHFFEQFVFCLVSPLCNTQEKFQLQNDKNKRKWVEHGFQNDRIDL